jgi:hypothetical protein
MTGRVGGLVEVDHTRTDILLQVTIERCASRGDWSIMSGADKHCEPLAASSGALVELHTVGKVFEEKGPVAGVDGRRSCRRLYHVRIRVGLDERHCVRRVMLLNAKCSRVASAGILRRVFRTLAAASFSDRQGASTLHTPPGIA